MKDGDLVRLVDLSALGGEEGWVHGYIFKVTLNRASKTFPIYAQSIVTGEYIYFERKELELIEDTDDGG